MSRLVEKIRKLLNLANNAGAAENEADVARQLAEQMMSAAGLTEADLLESKVDLAATVREQTSDSFARTDQWNGIVAMAVARIVGCASYTSKRPARREKCNGCDRVAGDHDHFFEEGWCIVWVGSDPQRVAAQELYGWVIRQIDTLANGARATARGQARPRVWMRSYKMGVADAIARTARDIAATHNAAPLSTEALIVRDAVKRAIDSHMGALRLRTVRRRADASAFAAGRNDGASVRMRNSVTGGHKRLGSGS